VVGFKAEFGLGEESLGEGGPGLLPGAEITQAVLAWAALGSSRNGESVAPFFPALAHRA
jgi:hypothetical protein